MNYLLFLLTSAVAYYGGWQTNQLCWGLWVTSLTLGWLTIIVSILRVVLHGFNLVPLSPEDLTYGSPLGGFRRKAPSEKEAAQDLSQLVPQPWRAPLLGLFALLLGTFVTFHFTMFHGIHGALLSIFVRMEPASLFGPNGYINADFSAILGHLLGLYWPMIVCTLIARRHTLFSGNPGANLQGIYRSVVKMHIFILLSAFLGVLGAAYGPAVYDQVVLFVLLFLFYYPWERKRAAVEAGEG